MAYLSFIISIFIYMRLSCGNSETVRIRGELELEALLERKALLTLLKRNLCREENEECEEVFAVYGEYEERKEEVKRDLVDVYIDTDLQWTMTS